MASRAERDTGPMLLIGAPCFACRREEFLPLMCQACQHKFCADHATPEAHACPQGVREFFAPLCPLCREPPRGWVRGASPQETQRQLQRHWAAPSVALGGCKVVLAEDGEQAVRPATRQCAAPTCTTVLHVAIECPQCHARFCTKHRAPQQHDCAACASTPSVRSRADAPRGALPNFRDKIHAAGNAGRAKLAAVSIPSGATAPPADAPSPSPSAAPPAARASRATQRRAAEERRSAIRAMQARHARGLLSESEQLVLAQKMAEDAAAAHAPSRPGCPVA